MKRIEPDDYTKFRRVAREWAEENRAVLAYTYASYANGDKCVTKGKQIPWAVFRLRDGMGGWKFEVAGTADQGLPEERMRKRIEQEYARLLKERLKVMEMIA